MSRKVEPLTSDQIKDVADRAEGLKPPHSGGRPTSYQPSFAEQAVKLCKLGATDAEMADFFEVVQSTFYRWKNEYPAFSEALKAAKAEADDRVERSLYNRAVGYTFDSEKVFQFQGEIVRAKTKEHVPPDVTAQIFWLKNRRSQEWRDVRQHEVGGPGDFAGMPDDELLREIKARAKTLGVAVPKHLDS